MTELYYLMLKQQREKNNSLLLTEKIFIVTLIGINLQYIVFYFYIC